jgi:hypothetical protein
MTRELINRAGKYKEFFEQNNEKPTRAFYKIGKTKNRDDNTRVIKDGRGESFTDEKARGKYIGEHFGNLYKKKIDKILEFENYLWELNNQEGNNIRKVSEEQKVNMESEFTLNELEQSLDKSNMDSAPGWDGISYFFMKKFWNIIGPILTKAMNESIREGELSINFRTGLIKIIPKKGNAEKIEEWRPITLLSCAYKVISGAVANRIEKVLPDIIGRAQKGFMKNRNIHMCNLNIIDSISQAWLNREETGILCVDFSKAFDSVEHYVIEQVFKFFNFGDFMTRTIQTLLKKRMGTVILTNGYSEKFDIKRGTPQGDRTSPYIFIMCIEILLIKIKRLENEDKKVNIRGLWKKSGIYKT